MNFNIKKCSKGWSIKYDDYICCNIPLKMRNDDEISKILNLDLKNYIELLKPYNVIFNNGFIYFKMKKEAKKAKEYIESLYMMEILKGGKKRYRGFINSIDIKD